MPVALLTLELGIEHAQSLKDRRQAVRSLKDKLRHGFNVSVAEMDEAVVWNRATLGVAAVSASLPYLMGQLREVEAATRRLSVGLGCELLDTFVELFEAGEEAATFSPEDTRATSLTSHVGEDSSED